MPRLFIDGLDKPKKPLPPIDLDRSPTPSAFRLFTAFSENRRGLLLAAALLEQPGLEPAPQRVDRRGVSQLSQPSGREHADLALARLERGHVERAQLEPLRLPGLVQQAQRPPLTR